MSLRGAIVPFADMLRATFEKVGIESVHDKMVAGPRRNALCILEILSMWLQPTLSVPVVRLYNRNSYYQESVSFKFDTLLQVKQNSREFQRKIRTGLHSSWAATIQGD